MIVVDASTIVAGLLRSGPARARLAQESMHAPHLVDTEVVHALRALVRREAVGLVDAERALVAWRRVGIKRWPTIVMIERIWELRDNVSAYDAAYVALAEALGCAVVTADRQLAAATGPRCTIEVVPG